MRTPECILSAGWMKGFLLLFAVIASVTGLPAQCATAYFVDAQAGNDTWSGQQQDASADDGPWRSLRRVATAPLEPGDTIHLRCGSVWRETLALIRGGAADRPIVVKPYGNDCEAEGGPVIDAAVPLTGWRHMGGSIYAAKVDFDVADVYVDGHYLPPARYPHTGWLHAAQPSGPSITMIHDPGLASIRNRGLAGAKVRVRSVDWFIEARLVAGLDGDGKLDLAKAAEFPIRPGAGYYLLGQPWMLSYPGAWVYDAEAGEVQVWLPDSSSPGGHLVEAPKYRNGLTIAGAGYIDVENLLLRHSRLSGVMVENSHEINLRGISVLDSGQNGISIEGSQAIRVLDSAVKRSQWNGIVATQSTGLTVRGNAVEDSSMVGSPSRGPAAINLGQASWVLVDANTIKNSGYIGIRFKRHARVTNNTIVDSCQVLNDCGAIYAWANNDSRPELSSEVVGNLIDGTRPSDADTPYPSYASGIYLDDLTNGVKVTDNTVTNADSGVHIHNGFDLVVESNTLRNNRRNQIYLSMGHAGVSGTSLSNNTFSGNTLEYDGTSIGVEIRTEYPLVRHAAFNNDHYVTVGNLAIAYESPPPGREGSQFPHIYNLDRWRAEKQQELGGTFSTQQVKNDTRYPLTVLDSDFSGGVHGWNAWSPDGTGTIAWRAACRDSRQGCLELNPKSKLVLAISRRVQIAPGGSCELRVTARTDAIDNPIQIRLRRDTPPFSSAGLSTHALIGQSWGVLVFRFITRKDWKGQSQIELKATGGRPVQVAALRLNCR